MSNNSYLVNAPSLRGLYFVWEGLSLAYVGESGALDLRMKDIKNNKHPLNESAGDKMFKSHRFFSVSFYPLQLGRVEMEELLTSEAEVKRSGRPVPKYNKMLGNRRYK